MKPPMSTLYLRELNPHQTVRLFAKHDWHYLELSECHAHDLTAQGDPTQAGKAFRQFSALAEIGYEGIFNLEIPGRRSPMPVREARLDYAKVLASYMVKQTPLESTRQDG